MENFNADSARHIVNSLLSNEELSGLLVEIKAKAEQGGIVLHVHHQISSKTVDSLRAKGFAVAVRAEATVQKDNLYYSIYW